MAVTFGRADIEVDIDGHGLPAQTRVLGEEAGTSAGDGFEKGWTNKLKGLGAKVSSTFKKNGELSGTNFAKGFDDSAPKKLAGSLDKFGDALKRNQVQVANHGASLKHWQAIALAVTVLIIGAGNDIAVLGSAVGAGTFVLGAAIASLAIGAGVLITAFKGLSGDITKLPRVVRPAAQAFADFKTSLKDLRTALTVATFRDSAASFKSLTKTVKGLTPALEGVAASAGRVFNSFAAGLAPGTRGFDTLNAVIKASGPIFERIAAIAGTFLQAFGNALASPAMAASVNQLLDWLNGIAVAFEKFTSGPGFDEWLAHATTTFGAVGRLIDALGKMLNGLVTDKTVKQTSDFIDGLTRFVPTIGKILDLGNAINPLGLIAQALDGIAKALDPLLGPLTDLGTALHDVASIMIDEWGKGLTDIANLLAPVVTDLTDFVKQLKHKDIQFVADALLAMAAAFVVLKGAKGLAGVATKLGKVTKGIKEVGLAKGTLTGLGAGLVASFTTEMTSDVEKQNPIETMIQTAVTGALVGGPIGAAAGLIAGIFMAAFTNPEGWAKMQTDVTTQTSIVTGNILIWAQGLWTTITIWLGSIVQSWNQFWIDLGTSVVTWGASILANIGAWLSGIITGFITWGIGVLAWWNKLWTDVWNFIVQIWNNIMSWIVSVVGNVVASVKNAFNDVSSWWNGLWKGVGDFFKSIWDGIVKSARDSINTVIGILNGIIKPINDVLAGIKNITGGLINLKIPSIPGLPKTATGGVFDGAQARILGEAGAEAVVPLRRDLSRVDPSVRELSAFAQGKRQPAGPQKVITVQAGAVQVAYAGVDPSLVGTSAIDRLIAKL